MADDGANFALDTWIGQLRFEAEASVAAVQAMLYWFLLVVLFYQIMFSFQLYGVIVMPDQALVIAIFVFLLVLLRMGDDVRLRYGFVRDYRRLLADVFTGEIQTGQIAERYRTIKTRERQKHSWWPRRKQPQAADASETPPQP